MQATLEKVFQPQFPHTGIEPVKAQPFGIYNFRENKLCDVAHRY